MTIYKANTNTDFYSLIGFLAFIWITVWYSIGFSKSSFLILMILSLVFVVFNLFESRLSEIHIDRENLMLTLNYSNYFNVKKKFDFDFKIIEFTYKKQATSFRSGIKNVCILYSSSKKIAQIIPGDDGWSEESVRAYVMDLIELGIKRKFIGYSLIDADI